MHAFDNKEAVGVTLAMVDVVAANLIAEDITFGYGGRAGPLRGPGLGVNVDPAALERMTVARREVRYD